MSTDVMDILRATDLLGSASTADLEAIAAASRPRAFRRGQILFSAGDPGDTGVIGQKMTQEQLAHRVGGTRQSVNGALRGFERRGWIEVHDRAVTVKQVAALSRFADN